MRFHQDKYNILMPNVYHVVNPENRIQREGQREYICKKCDNGLRPRPNFPSKFKPCALCSGDGVCPEKKKSVNMSKVFPIVEPKHKKAIVKKSTNLKTTSVNQTKMSYASVVKNKPVCSEYLPEISHPLFWTAVLGHFAAMGSFAELEKYLMEDNRHIFGNLPELPPFVGNKQLQSDHIDPHAAHDMPHDTLLQKPFPVHTTGDGNCFVNSLSRLVYGDEKHSDEMRVRLVLDSVQNMKSYLDSDTLKVGIQSFVPTDNFVDQYLLYSMAATSDLPHGGSEHDFIRAEYYRQLTYDLRVDSTWCNIWQFHQAANVLQCQVKCIYPKLRETERRIFHRGFLPLPENCCRSDTVNIMFCRSSLFINKVNHFVPVVEQQFDVNVPHISVPSKKFSQTTTQKPIEINDTVCETPKRNKRKRKQETPRSVKRQTVLIEDETMDCIDMIDLTDSVPGFNCKWQAKSHFETPVNSLRIPKMAANGNSSKRKQSVPRKILHPNSVGVRKSMVKEFEFDVVSDKNCDFLPFMDSVDTPVENKNKLKKKEKKQKTNAKCLDVGTQTPQRKQHRRTKAGQCTLCRKAGQRFRLFFETSYPLSEKMKEKYRCKDDDGDEVICGQCHKALLHGKSRHKWLYRSDYDALQRDQFILSLQDFPDFMCTICHRRLFERSVSKFVKSQYDEQIEEIAKCLESETRIKSPDGNEYICTTCSQSMYVKKKMPFQAVANDLDVPPQPSFLKQLNTLERRCISLNIPFMHIQSVRQRGKKMKGPCVNVPASMEPICCLLPRIPEHMKTVLVKLKRRLEYSNHYLYDYIRPKLVMQSLLWLKANNPLYKENVEINREWYEQLEESEIFDIVEDEFDSDCESCDIGTKMTANDEIEQRKTDVVNTDRKKKAADEELPNDDDSDGDFHEEQEHEKRKAKMSIEPSSTCVQFDQLDEAVFGIAPGENSRPNYILFDEQFEVKCFPDFFPKAGGSFHAYERKPKLQLRRYVNQRLLNHDARFSHDKEYIFSMQYLVELKQLEEDKNVYLRNHSFSGGNKSINASMMRNATFVDNLVSKDHAYKFMRNVRGTPAYWQRQLFETLAIFNQIGKPTWFLTLSAAEHLWPEMLQAIGCVYGQHFTVEQVMNMNHAQRSKLLRRNPVTTIQMWKNRLESFFNIYIKNDKACPLGKIMDYIIKIEFQARGSPHAHVLLWAEDAPTIGLDADEMICDYVDKFCSGMLLENWEDAPDDSSTEELETLVRRVQMHKHNPMCRASKKSKCRHSFPKLASLRTVITRPDIAVQLTTEEKRANDDILSKVKEEIENDPMQSLEEVCDKCSIDPEDYMNAVIASETSQTIILKREPKDVFVNNYNPKVISLWKANMDLQYCADKYQVVNYVMNYVLKPEKGMSELMKRVKENYHDHGLREQMKQVTKVFTGKREVSIEEALYRVLSFPLCYKSLNTNYINTNLRENRDLVPKKKEELAMMKDDDEDVFEKSIHDRYEARPDSLESMCLADFGTWYDYKKSKPIHGIELKNGMGFMSKRKKQYVVRLHPEKKNTEEFFRSQLILFWPYRNESELMGTFDSYCEHYNHVIDIIETNSEHYNMFQEEIEEALIEFEKAKPVGDGDKDFGNEDNNEAEKEEEEEEKEKVSELTKKFRAEAKKQGKMTTSEYILKVRRSNKKQKELVMWCRNHVKKQIIDMKKGKTPDGFRIVLTGPGGTGKSHVISLINHDVVDLFARTNALDPNDMFQEARNPNKPTALLTAMTGTAAFNINGSTLHSVLLLYQNNLAKEKACILQSQLHQLQLLTIDEFSMMGTKSLQLTNERCCFVKQNISSRELAKDQRRHFGNVNILLVGDLYQLPAVRQGAIYKPPPIRKLEDFQEPLWNEFQLHELNQIMRQKDRDFADLLTRIRTSAPKANSYDDNLLQEREITLCFDDAMYPKDVLHVFAQNDGARSHNESMLQRIENRQLYTSVAKDHVEGGSFGFRMPQFSSKPTDCGNLQEIFQVKVGSRVVLTNNLHVADGLTNGAYGTVTCIVLEKFNPQKMRAILVQFDSPSVGISAKGRSRWKGEYPQSVPIIIHEAKFPLRRGKMFYQASRRQFPLFLAWGVTIHKVQGLTMDKIVVDMDPKKGKFQKGQAYVAFSRVTSYSGLYIKNYCLNQIKVDNAVDAEMENIRKRQVTPLPEPKFNQETGDLKIGHLNVNGLLLVNLDKTEDLKMTPFIEQLDVLCLSETHLCSWITLHNKFWEDFAVFRKDREKAGGGVLIAVRKHCVAKPILLKETFLEILGVSITKGNFNGNVYCVYIPPMTNKAIAAEELEKILQDSTATDCVIMGDINEDLLSNNCSKVEKTLQQIGFCQHIKYPTTIHGSLLDHLYTTDNIDVVAEVCETYISDHDFICAALLKQQLPSIN
jgi:DNA replication protein DnaC